MKYSAAVIGLGNIGMIYDYHLNNQTHLYTHSATYDIHPGFELIGGVDNDSTKQTMFSEKYNKTTFSTVSDMLDALSPDVISICTPFHHQAKVFFELVEKYTPKAIIFEKPMTGNFQQAQQIVDCLQQKNIVSVVNYIRRFEPGAQQMVQMLRAGEIGPIKKIIGWYSKDMTSNGCHIVDLVNSVMNVDKSTSIDSIQVSNNKDEIKINFNDAQLHLFLAPEKYRRFEIEFVGTDGMMHYMHSGKEIRVHKIIKDKAIDSISVLDDDGVLIPNDINRYQWFTVDALYQSLTANKAIASTAHTALVTEEIISKIGEYRD